MKSGKSEPNGRLTVNMLDGFSAEFPVGAPVNISNTKACALISYLCLKPKKSETRERLVGLLWSESSEELARASLRQCIKQLKTAFEKVGYNGLVISHQHISLVDDLITSDVQNILDQLTAQKVPQQMLQQGEASERLLYGFDDLDPSFSAWLQVSRQNFSTTIAADLDNILASQDTQQRENSARAILNSDPSHEPAHRHLIKKHAKDGNISAALDQYKSLWDLLDEDYDMEPSEQTISLIGKVKSGDIGATSAEPSFPIPNIAPPTEAANPHKLPVIGVCQFRAPVIDSETEYFVDGFQRELTASLVRFRDWIILDGQRTGEVQFSNWPTNTPNIQYLVEGNISVMEDITHCSVTLKNVQTGQYIWGEQFDIAPQNLVKVQKYIVSRIAVALNIYVSHERLEQAAAQPDVSWQIYNLWLLGQSLSFRWRPKFTKKAEKIFRQIIDQAPRFAPAYSSLVQLENTRHLVSPGILRDRPREESTLELAKTAVSLDPLNTRTQLSAAWSFAMNDRFQQAALYYNQARELNQNDSWTMVSAALGLAFCGNLNEARAAATAALDLDHNPSPSHCEYQSNIRFLEGDYEGCDMWSERAQTITRDSDAWRVAALSHLGRNREAKALGLKFIEQTQKNWVGGEPARPADVGYWFIQCFPIAEREARHRLITGLNEAGIPVPNTRP